MIDLVTPKSLKKSSKKKSKSIEFGLSSENVLKPDVKRRRRDETVLEEVEEEPDEPESTVPDEHFMLPSDIKFVKSEKTLEVDDSLIPSDLDDPNNCRSLSQLIGSRSNQRAPESCLQYVWSHKRKVLKKNRKICKCYTDLENSTLSRLKSHHVLKSKKKFTEHFSEFEKQASDILCEYPYCKRPESLLPSTSRVVTCKLVKKSKRHKICKKTKTSQLVIGVKRGREEVAKKVRFSSYFINEVIRLMLENRKVWSTETLTKLIKTRQLNSKMMVEVARVLLESRDVSGLLLLVSYTRTCTERHLVNLVNIVLSNPVYLSNVDGQEKQTLNEMLTVLLSLPFESSSMKRSMKSTLSPQQAKTLLEFIYEKLFNSAAVYSKKPNLNQAVQWCDVVIETYFSTFISESELIKKINNSINQHLHSCKSLFSLNEFLFRIKHVKKSSH